MGLLERIFGLKMAGTTPGREILAGMVIFVTSAYILAVQPSLMEMAGMPKGAVFLSTALTGALASILMAAMANLPLTCATAMGPNIFIAFTMILGLGFSWQSGVIASIVSSGMLFMFCLTKYWRILDQAIPKSLKQAIGIGIGLFIIYVGLNKIGLFVEKGNFFPSFGCFALHGGNSAPVCLVLGLAGISIMGLVVRRKWPGGLLAGLAMVWLLGIILELAGIYKVNASFSSLIPNFQNFSLNRAFSEYASFLVSMAQPENWSGPCQEKGFALLLSPSFLGSVMALFFMTFFADLGTAFVIGGLKFPDREENLLDDAGKLLVPTALGGFLGGFLGSTPTTAFLESCSGIIHGGRTGLAALVTALLFLASIFICPIILAIPAYAIGAALVVTGFAMIGSFPDLKSLNFRELLPALTVIVAIPLLRSIHDGIFLSIILYALLSLIPGKGRQRPAPATFLMAAAFILYYVLCPR